MTGYRQHRKELAQQGFTVMKQVFELEDFDPVYQAIFSLFSRQCRSLEKLAHEERPWTRQEFHDTILALREQTPEKFSDAYDCAQYSIAKYQLLGHKKLNVALGKLFHIRPELVSGSGLQIRMDPPRDSRNSLEWHQDRPYYPETVEPDNGVVAWIPLQDVSEGNGTIIACPGSHAEGLVTTVSERRDVKGSEQRRLPTDLTEKYPPFSVSAELGDVVFLSCLLFHCSGSNQSNRFRFTTGLRSHRMTSDYLPPADFRMTPNKRYPLPVEQY